VVDQENEESFAELFEQSLTKVRRRVSPGEKVTGTVSQVGAERAIIDLGDGLDGIADLGELAEKGETSTVKKGDRIELYVLRFENRMAVLAKSIGKGPGARLALEESARTGVPVEGTVLEVNKGGYVVEAAGVRGFCPLGQMDTRRIEDPATMIGQKLMFRVTELRGSRDIVLSRRQLLEAEGAEKAAKTRAQLAVGARFQGEVTGVRDFGAFVDIGGIEGLIPVSELSYGRVRPQEVVRAGQQVEVEVIRIEPPGPKDRSERLTFSMRALAVDPWDDVLADLTEGSIIRGKVQRVQPFGAFVEIVPGVDGLLHVSAFGKRVGHPSEMVTVGDEIAVRVEAIDGPQRRISLAYVSPEELVKIVGEVAPEAVPAPVAAPQHEAPVAKAAKAAMGPSRCRPAA
jgi:small subunit ribosomal protein S1